MGNKVISLGNRYISDNSPSSNTLEVYRDISMVSEVKKNLKWIAKDVNVKAVFNSLRNIFSWIPGERILDPEFGSRLRTFLYEGITDYNKELIIAEIKGTCLKWEPRVNIVHITDSSSLLDTEENTVRLDIIFTIPSLSDTLYSYSYIYNRIL